MPAAFAYLRIRGLGFMTSLLWLNADLVAVLGEDQLDAGQDAIEMNYRKRITNELPSEQTTEQTRTNHRQLEQTTFSLMCPTRIRDSTDYPTDYRQPEPPHTSGTDRSVPRRLFASQALHVARIH
jgi:hypothetical protein